jgi:hypothetical protein
MEKLIEGTDTVVTTATERLSEINKGLKTVYELASIVKKNPNGDDEVLQKLGTFMQAVGDFSNVPGVEDMMKFYGTALTAIGDKLANIAGKLGEQNLRDWGFGHYPQWKNVWFGVGWALAITDKNKLTFRKTLDECCKWKPY